MLFSIRSSLLLRTAGPILMTVCNLLLMRSQPLSAAPPGVVSAATMLAADRAELALDTGLWRREFLLTQDEDSSPASEQSDDKNHQSRQALRSIKVQGNTDLVSLEGTLEEYFEEGEAPPVDSTGDDNLVTGEMPENLSDWEQAICNVSDGKALAAGPKGPSMITVIVAVVGVIVVIGAYMKK